MSQHSHDAVPHAPATMRRGGVEPQSTEPTIALGNGNDPFETDAVGHGTAGTAAMLPDPASMIDPLVEDAYWRDNYHRRPYADGTISFDHYRPAYRYGWESRLHFTGRRWDEVERELAGGWRRSRGKSRLGWSEAKQAARDAWQRVDRLLYELRG